jgi:hypothetical protein
MRRRSSRNLGASRAANNDASSPIISTKLADVLVLLVDTQSCTAIEVCSICAVCSALRVAAHAEDIWQKILFSAFPNCAALPRSVIEKRGHRWMYMQRLCKMPPLPAVRPQPPPPTISPSDLQLLVDVYVNDEHVTSLTVQDDQLALLLHASSVTVDLPVKRRVCDFIPNFRAFQTDEANFMDEASGLINSAWMDTDDNELWQLVWRVVAHLVFVGEGARHGKVVCVHDVRDGLLDNPISRLGRDWFVRQMPGTIDKDRLDLCQWHQFTIDGEGNRAIRIDDRELLGLVPDLESLELMVELNLALPRAPRWYAYEAINEVTPTLEEANAGYRRHSMTSPEERLANACKPLWRTLSDQERAQACLSAQEAVHEQGHILQGLGLTFFFNQRGGNGSAYDNDRANGVTLLHLIEACHWD